MLADTIVHQDTTVMQPSSEAANYFYSRNQSSRYWSGFMAYCNGLTLDEIADPAERAGWWGANKAQAAAEMPERDDDEMPSYVAGGEWY